jgi:hypothetical protein
MHIILTCTCGTKLSVPDSAVGKVIAFPKCKARQMLATPAFLPASEGAKIATPIDNLNRA